jgi:glutathione S-transferase
MAGIVGQVSGAIFRGLASREYTLGRKLAIVGGFTASGVRLARGMTVRKPVGARPEKPLTLWDFERCPHSRIVREALTELDLDVEVRPCPRGGTRFRPALQGGSGVPQLRDDNTGEHLVGSTVIVKHLFARYGNGSAPFLVNATPVRIATGLVARALTGGRGAFARPSRAPEKPLELFSFEASPYCRFARFVLCELELPYTLRNLGKGSPKRRAYIERFGKSQFPYLRDPNTGWEGFESLEIERYLERTYLTTS